MSHKLDFSVPRPRIVDPTVLDRTLFSKTIPLLAAQIDANRTSEMLRSTQLRSCLLNIPRTRNVTSDGSLSPNKRLLLIKASSIEELAPEERLYLEQNSHGLQPFSLALDYNYWTAEDIIEAIVPEELSLGSPAGFTVTGHVAHFNLRDEYLPFKHVIGQVVLDKNPGIKTVVNKLDQIDHKFRYFKMELLAGEPNYIVEAHESSCRFKFDFSTVYWNSRLHSEHERLVDLFQPGEIIVDAFAGVGPFAIPAAKKGCGVYANDLNPRSVDYLNENIGLNGVQTNIRTSLLDGGEYIRQSATMVWHNPFTKLAKPLSRRAAKALERKVAQDTCAGEVPDVLTSRRICHFVMNLPDTAIEFIGNFRGILIPLTLEPDFDAVYSRMPMVHCHCFTRELDPQLAQEDITKRVEGYLGAAIANDAVFHLVRAVAPNKNMYCISFRLPESVALDH